MDNANGKVAIITGGSRGIGAAIAERLAKDGLKVVINYAGSTVEAEALAGKIERAGGRATAAQADVSDPAAVARLFDATDVAFGGVDVLVNNAGIMHLASIGESDDRLFDSHVAINLKGTFNTLRKRRSGGGKADASSTYRPARPAFCTRHMASMPRPRPASKL